MPDAKGLSLPQKLGGWAKFWATQIVDVVRCIWPFENTIAEKFIAYGTTDPTDAQLVAIECFTDVSTGITTASTNPDDIFNITPSIANNKTWLQFNATQSTNSVTVTDPMAAIVGISAVYIATPIRVASTTIQGLYAVNQSQADGTYTIDLPPGTTISYDTHPIAITNITWGAGSPNFLLITLAAAWPSYNATNPGIYAGEWIRVTGVTPSIFNGTWNIESIGPSTRVVVDFPFPTATYVSGGVAEDFGVPPIYYSAIGSDVISVGFPGTDYVVGPVNTFNVSNPTSAGGAALFGDYTPSAPSTYQRTSSPYSIFFFTINSATNATATTRTFQGGVNITSGTGSGTSVTLNFTALSATYDVPTVTATSGTGSGSTVTLNWTTPFGAFLVGSYVLVTGATPSGWNGAWTVTASTTTSVTFTNTVTGSLSGTATVGISLFGPGQGVLVGGITPSAWNGYFTLTAATDTSITFANATSGTASGPGTVVPNGGTADIIYYLNESISNEVSIVATTWDLNNWGSDLVALAVGDSIGINYGGGETVALPQPIYYWDSVNKPSSAAAMGNGPWNSTGFFIAMPQRQVVAWGCSFTTTPDPLLIAWCDINDFTDWTPQVVNQAGSFRIASGSRIVGALQFPQQALVWTDIELWSMQYQGQPYVYGFNKIGIGCGLLARRAVCSQNGFIYWMGQSQIYMLSGNGIQPLPCPIWDVAFQDLDLANVDKITAGSNALFQEIAWYYPIQGGNGEVSNYIKFNTLTQTWDYGVLGRSAWTDESCLGQPIGFDPGSGFIYQHEISPDADGAAILSTVTTGYFAIADGDMMTTIDQVWPDMKWGHFGESQTANVQITFNSVDYPGQTPKTYGPYTVTENTTYISPRIRDRLISITVSSSDVGSFWRWGNIRYRFQTDGRY